MCSGKCRCIIALCVLSLCSPHCVQLKTHLPGLSQLSPVLSFASSASRNAAAPYGSTDRNMLEKIKIMYLTKAIYVSQSFSSQQLPQTLTSILFRRKTVKQSTSYIFCILYLLVDLLVVWVEAESPQKQVPGTFRRISILQLTLSSHDPQS